MKIGEMQFVVKEDYKAIKDKVEPNHKAEYVKNSKRRIYGNYDKYSRRYRKSKNIWFYGSDRFYKQT